MEQITVIFQKHDDSGDQSLSILLDDKLGEYREAVQTLLGLSDTIKYQFVLSRAGSETELSDNQTFREAGIKQNDKLVLYPLAVWQEKASKIPISQKHEPIEYESSTTELRYVSPQSVVSKEQWGLAGAGALVVIFVGFVLASLLKPNPPTTSTSSSPVAENPTSSNPADSITRSASPINPFESMRFPQPNCGDAMPTDPKDFPVNFYPVFVDYSESNLQIVTSRFCKDAYQMVRQDTNKEAIQVGSFTSFERAELFKAFLQKTFSSGDIGQPKRYERKEISNRSIAAPIRLSSTTERVSFNTGSTGATLYGKITTNQVKRYLLWCKSGQFITIQIQQGNVNVNVIDPDGRTIGTAMNGTFRWNGRLSSSGDYTVQVSAPKGSEYMLSVEVL